MKGDKLLLILIMLLISFFAAFTVGINKYSISVYRDKIYINKAIIISEIMVHGLSGLLLGLMSTKFVQDIYLLCAIAGIGGMVGQKLLYSVSRSFINSIIQINSNKDKLDRE